MRERLVLAFVGLTLAVIGLYGVPRAYFLADLVRDDTVGTLDSTANVMAALVAERLRTGGEVDVELLESGLAAADRVEYTTAGPNDLAVGGTFEDDGAVVEERSLASGGRLILSVSGDTVGRGVQEAILPLLLLGIGLAGAAAALGFLAARRLSRPFQELARSAQDLGHGHFDIEVPPYSVPEAQAIAFALSNAGSRLDQMVRREREFAVNASHQLRTPITALRLSLEDLAMWPETTEGVRDELANALAELDRLNGSINELLDLSRGRRLGQQSEVDLSALVAASARRWEARLEAEHRRLVVDVPGTIPARVATGPVEQILDVLIDNARLHGRGQVTVATRDAGSHLEVTIGDEGVRSLGAEIFQRGVTTRATPAEGHGVGLAVAAELAEFCGGHLSLDAAAPTTRFVLWLPAARGADERPGQPSD